MQTDLCGLSATSAALSAIVCRCRTICYCCSFQCFADWLLFALNLSSMAQMDRKYHFGLKPCMEHAMFRCDLSATAWLSEVLHPTSAVMHAHVCKHELPTWLSNITGHLTHV